MESLSGESEEYVLLQQGHWFWLVMEPLSCTKIAQQLYWHSISSLTWMSYHRDTS